MSEYTKATVEVDDDTLYQWYVESGRNATALAPRLQCGPASARRRIARLLARMEQHPIATPQSSDIVNRVQELLTRSNIDPLTIDRIRQVKLKSYGIGIKNADGQIETQGLHSTGLTIDPVINASDNPCLTQAPPITVMYADVPRIMRNVRSVVVVSDVQCGYLNGPNGLEPIHDPQAINVATQIIAAEQPDELVWIGDFLDLTAFSRWPQHPEFSGCSQPSIDEAGRILAEMISAAGRQCEKRIFVSGNHDIRLEKYALANAMAFLGLRRAGKPDEWPILSMPFLLHFEALGISYSGHYPSGQYWILDDLVATHAPLKRLEAVGSVVHGHDHKLTQETYAQHGRHKRVNYFQYSVGCLCNVGSRTDPTSLMRTVTPSDRARTDWAQGICTVDIIDGKLPMHQVTLTRIQDGRALHRGQAFEARGQSDVAA